jgi:uncharacterized protein YjiS (DUF1127 family)
MAPGSDRRNIEITRGFEKQPGHRRPRADKGDKEMSSISIHTIPATSPRHPGAKAAFNLAAAAVVATVAAIVAAIVAKAFRALSERTGAPSRLYGLSDYALKDIGLGRGEIGQGPAESFWRE